MKRIQPENWIPLEEALPLSTPFVINVDPAASCNFRCQFCFHSNDKPFRKGIMQWDTYKRTIKDISRFDSKLKTLRLYAYGEPLLNPRFADMIKYAKDKNITDKIDTTTNGSLFNPQLNLEIINAGIDRINISVIGINAKQYLKLSRYKINFERYVDNIKHLFANRGQCTMFIKINGDVISKEDVNVFLEIFGPISDGIAVEHIMNCWHDTDMHGIETNTEVGVYGQPLSRVEVCPYIFYSFCVNFDGEISACFLDWQRDLVVGDTNILSVREIWNGGKLAALRKKMLMKERSTLKICKDCNQLIAGQPVNIDHIAEELLKKYELSRLPS